MNSYPPRRHKRFDMQSAGCRLARVEHGGTALRLQPCELINLSFGGICFRSSEELEPEGFYSFLLDLSEPIKELILLKSNIRWVHSCGSVGWIIGGAVIESTRSWLGGLDDPVM